LGTLQTAVKVASRRHLCDVTGHVASSLPLH